MLPAKKRKRMARPSPRLRQKSQPFTAEALQKMWESIDSTRVWGEVLQSVSLEVDAYERARAKSRAGAAHQVLL